MDRPRLSEINLNLLLALDAILSEKSVSRAARRVGVSQPAMSQSLRHLREIFDDALLVRDRGTMVLTPAAERVGSRGRLTGASLSWAPAARTGTRRSPRSEACW